MRWYSSSLLLVALSVAACGGSPTTTTPPPPPPTPTVDHVVIDNGDFTLSVGEARQLQVRPLTATGQLVTTATVTYTTSVAAVATVSSGGAVTAIAPGVTTVTATSAGKTATVQVTVRFIPVASISIEVQRQVIKANDTTRVIATLRDASNTILLGRTITWQSSDSSTALVGLTGLVFGLRAGGPVTISASVEGMTASITLLVAPALVASVRILPDSAILTPGISAQFSVEVKDEFGGIVESPVVAWRTIGGDIVTVSPTGLVTAVHLGEVLILATVNGVTGQSLVRVSLPELAKFRLSVNNHLRFPVLITQNDVVIGQAAANSITAIERPMTEHATFGWALVQPAGRGELMSGTLPDIVNPTGTISMPITNVLADGRVYFTPSLRSFNGGKNPVNFPIRELASLCLCAVSSDETVSRDYGYWLLVPTSVMEVFGPADVSMTGPKIVVPILAADVDPLTGIWRYNLLITP